MPKRVIAIGDIHGCAVAFRALLSALRPQPDDTLVVLGDCVDRGPESCRVIEMLFELREKCRLVPLLGNHEEMMLNYIDGKPQPDDWLQCGGAATIDSYRDATGKPVPIPLNQIDYIRGWGDYFETPSHFFAHANYDAERPLAKQYWQTMRWQSLKNYFPGPHVSGKTAIVGHSSQKDGEILKAGHILCIDTFCWGGGWLTAIDTTSGKTWQFDRAGRPRGAVGTVQPEKPA
jgi:serine/threonine protein phosphatase 1